MVLRRTTTKDDKACDQGYGGGAAVANEAVLLWRAGEPAYRIQKVMEDANLKLASVATDASTSSSGRPPTSISVRTVSIAATLTPSADRW